MDHAETDSDAEGDDYSPEESHEFADALERAILGELSEMRELMAGTGPPEVWERFNEGYRLQREFQTPAT